MFDYQLGQRVVHKNNPAKITARAEYLDSENVYFLDYEDQALNDSEFIWVPESSIYDASDIGAEHDETAEAASKR